MFQDEQCCKTSFIDVSKEVKTLKVSLLKVKDAAKKLSPQCLSEKKSSQFLHAISKTATFQHAQF